MWVDACKDWSYLPLGKVAKRVRRQLSIEPENVLMITSTAGWVMQSDKYSRFMAGESLKKYVELKRGEFSYNKGNSKTYPQGCVFKLDKWDVAAVPNVYISFAIDEKKLNSNFISQFFIAGGLNDQLYRVISSTARSNGLLNISSEDFFACKVPIPTLAEQQKIASILSSVDRVIDLTEQEINKLKDLKKGMMQELLTKGIGHTKFKDSPVGRIPESWETNALGSIAKINRGSSPRPAGDPKYFKGAHIPWITVGEVTKDDSPYLVKTKSYLTEAGKEKSTFIPADTVVLTNSGATLGVPKITKIDACANDGIAIFTKLNEKVDPHFLYYFLKNMTDKFQNSIARGVGQTNLNTDLISEVIIPMPDLTEQKKIADSLMAVWHLQEAKEQKYNTIIHLKKGLMQDLLTGKVRVKV